MQHNRPSEPNEVLTQKVAERLLGRASELDAARMAGASLSELRAAATEAGISPHAFEAALAELQGAGGQVPETIAQPRRRGRLWVFGAGAVALVAMALAWTVMRTVPTPVASAPMAEEAILLRCLPASEAAELIRPLLRLPSNTVVSTAAAPRVLTVRATAEQMRNVHSLLDRYEGTGSGACPVTPAPR